MNVKDQLQTLFFLFGKSKPTYKQVGNNIENTGRPRKGQEGTKETKYQPDW